MWYTLSLDYSDEQATIAKTCGGCEIATQRVKIAYTVKYERIRSRACRGEDACNVRPTSATMFATTERPAVNLSLATTYTTLCNEYYLEWNDFPLTICENFKYNLQKLYTQFLIMYKTRKERRVSIHLASRAQRYKRLPTLFTNIAQTTQHVAMS